MLACGSQMVPHWYRLIYLIINSQVNATSHPWELAMFQIMALCCLHLNHCWPTSAQGHKRCEFIPIFTQGQFWPSGIVVACVCVCMCVCVCVSVNHELVRAIIHQPFKLGSPNLDQRCKRPWIRSLLFCGVIDSDLQGQIELDSPNLPHFGLVSLSGRLVKTK